MSASREGASAFETLLITMIVGVLVVTFLGFSRRLEEKARRTAMRMELANIRTAIQLYRMLNKRYPADLRVLLTEKYLFPDELSAAQAGEAVSLPPDFFKRSYLETGAVDAEGFPLDPYGRRYKYFAVTGAVAPLN